MDPRLLIVIHEQHAKDLREAALRAQRSRHAPRREGPVRKRSPRRLWTRRARPA